MTADGRNLVNKGSLLGLAPLPIPAQPAIVAKTVEVWRGGKRVELTFNESEILESLNATEVAEGREADGGLAGERPRGGHHDGPEEEGMQGVCEEEGGQGGQGGCGGRGGSAHGCPGS